MSNGNPDHAPTCPYYSREAAKGNANLDCNCTGPQGAPAEPRPRECWMLSNPDGSLSTSVAFAKNPNEKCMTDAEREMGCKWVRMAEATGEAGPYPPSKALELFRNFLATERTSGRELRAVSEREESEAVLERFESWICAGVAGDPGKREGA